MILDNSGSMSVGDGTRMLSAGGATKV